MKLKQHERRNGFDRREIDLRLADTLMRLRRETPRRHARSFAAGMLLGIVLASLILGSLLLNENEIVRFLWG